MMNPAERYRGLAILMAGMLLLVLPLLSLVPSAALSQQKDRRELIAVLELEGVDAKKAEVTALTERLREMLLKTGRYKMVDRSQLNRILDEQALQQVSCTGKDCVVEVGRILGVQKIVTGKAVKLDENMWLISIMMVDVETAETLALESIRHRGDVFTLIEGGIPGIALKLAAHGLQGGAPTQTEAQPGAQGRAGAVQPPGIVPGTAPGTVARLALFPSLLQGRFAGRLKASYPKVVKGLSNWIAKNPHQITLEYSYYAIDSNPSPHDQFRKLALYAEAEEKSWSGTFSKSPNDRFIFQSGKKLGVDLVLLHKSENKGGGRRKFEIYLYDIGKIKVYRRAGGWGKGKWTKNLAKALKSMFKEYRREYRQGG